MVNQFFCTTPLFIDFLLLFQLIFHPLLGISQNSFHHSFFVRCQSHVLFARHSFQVEYSFYLSLSLILRSLRTLVRLSWIFRGHLLLISSYVAAYSHVIIFAPSTMYPTLSRCLYFYLLVIIRTYFVPLPFSFFAFFKLTSWWETWALIRIFEYRLVLGRCCL